MCEEDVFSPNTRSLYCGLQEGARTESIRFMGQGKACTKNGHSNMCEKDLLLQNASSLYSSLQVWVLTDCMWLIRL